MQDIDIYGLFRRNIRSIIAVILITTLVGYGTSFLLSRRYTATALLLVRPQQAIKLDTKSSNREFLDFPIGSAAVETPSKTYIEIIKSPDFVGKLVHMLKLDEKENKPGFLTRNMPGSLRSTWEALKEALKQTLSILVYGRAIPEDKFADTVKTVQNSLALEARTDTYIFTITYTTDDPQLAADVANTSAKLFVEYMDKARQSEINYSIEKLKAQLVESQQTVDIARKRVEEFKKANATFKYDTEYDADLKVIGDMETELAKVDATLASQNAVANQNNLSTKSLEAKRASILQTLQERKAGLVGLPAMESELKRIQAAETVAVATYNAVNTKYHEAILNNSSTTREIQAVASAVPPKTPSSPNQPVFALVALLSGVVAGVGLAFLREYLNQRIRSIRDVEDFVGVKVLASIPRMSANELRLAGL